MADYVIQKGDTLSQIAQKQGTSVSELAKANSIADPNKIYAGQVLKLPTVMQAPTSQSNLQVPNTQSASNYNAILAGVQESLKSFESQLKSQQSQQVQPSAELTQARNTQADLTKQITDAAEALKGAGARKTELANQYGIDENTQKLQENNTAIATKLAEYKQIVATLEGQPIAKAYINADIQKASKKYANDVAILEAYGNALQGNLTLSQNRINDILQNEYADKKQELDNLKLFYDLNSDVLTKEESKYSKQIEAQIKAKEDELKSIEDNGDKNASLLTQIFNSGNNPVGFDLTADYATNLQKYGSLLKNATVDTGGTTNFIDVMQSAIDQGATPQEAARAAAAVSEQSGIQVDQKTLNTWTETAKKLTRTQTPVTTTQEQTQKSGGIFSSIGSFFSNLFGEAGPTSGGGAQ